MEKRESHRADSLYPCPNPARMAGSCDSPCPLRGSEAPPEWLTHVPTPLAILRREDDLPRWQRVDPAVWEWTEVEAT